jgi:hypothetical protein
MDPNTIRRRPFDPTAILARLGRGEAASGSFAMRIARDGSWWHEGERIGRPELVKLFASILHRAGDGSYWLVTPVEQGRIEVEDAPFTAVEVRSTGEGQGRRLAFRTNLDAWVTAGPGHPLKLRPDHGALDAAGAAMVPYLTVRDGLEARLLRPVYYELALLAEPMGDDRGQGLGVWSDGVWFPLGSGDS